MDHLIAGLLGLPHWSVLMLEKQDRIEAQQKILLERTGWLMANQEDLMAAVQANQAAIDEVSTNLTAALAKVQEDVDFLKAQAQQGVDLTAAIEQLQASTAKAQAVSQQLAAVDPVPENPAPQS